LVPVGIIDDGRREEISIDRENNDIWTEKGDTSSSNF